MQRKEPRDGRPPLACIFAEIEAVDEAIDHDAGSDIVGHLRIVADALDTADRNAINVFARRAGFEGV